MIEFSHLCGNERYETCNDDVSRETFLNELNKVRRIFLDNDRRGRSGRYW